MAAPTALVIAKRLLRDFGVTSLDAASPANQVVPIEEGDLDDIALNMTAAFQEIADDSPAEAMQQPGSAFLHAPANLTLTATEGSTTVSAVTTYASWMEGCTIRIDGDDQDNELINSTTLARAYVGTTGSAKAATIYGDAVTLDETVQHVMEPLFLSNQWPVPMANSLEEFMREGGWPMLADLSAGAMTSPFYLFSRRPTGNRPWIWIQDAYYDPTLNYLKRRLRFSPMPDQKLSAGFTIMRNPIRITTDSIAEDTATVTGTLSPALTGSYTRVGTYNSRAIYRKGAVDSDSWLFWNVTDAKWYLASAQATLFTAPTNRFSLTSSAVSPAGTYTAGGSYTGAPVVTVANTVELPITNAWSESIYLPICRQLLTGCPQWKNDSALPEVARAYKVAKFRLINSVGSKGAVFARYPRSH